MKEKHGFENIAKDIAKNQGVSTKRARAELAASTRKSSAEAKKRNPNLLKVKGKPK